MTTSVRRVRVEEVMGLPISIDVREQTPDLDPVFESLREADERFSPFRPDSELCRLERGELPWELASADMIEVLEICADYQRRTGGAFRALLPGRGLDPSAVVKGWAVQRAANLLRDAGAGSFCVNAGGDVVMAGTPEPGRPWRAGVRHPDRPDRMCVVFGLSDGAIATSAGYERGDHILDGRTGRPADGLRSVTVLADDLTIADTTATAAYALGAEGAEWAAAQPGCLVYAIDDRDRVLRSTGLDDLIIAAQAVA